MTAELDLHQKAVYERLVAANVAGGRVHDSPPTTFKFPYVQIEESIATPNGCDGFEGTEEFLTLDVWSREGGFSEAKTIAGAIRAELHETVLDVDGHTALVWVADMRPIRDPDGVTFRVMVRLRISSYRAS